MQIGFRLVNVFRFDLDFSHSTCLAAAVLLAGCSVEAFLPTPGMFSRVAKRASGHNLAALSMKDAALIVQNKVVSSRIISRFVRSKLKF